MNFNLRSIVRLLFLTLIFVLWYIGKINLWGPLVLIGLLAVPLLGRIYCGWLCPISTSIDILKPLFPKPPLKKYQKYLLNYKANTIFYIISLAYMIFFMKTHSFIPFFILFIPVGLILSFLFGETVAHRNCLIGITYSWFGKFSRFSYFADKSKCIACLKCIRICPNQCLSAEADNKPATDKKNCLICGKCSTVCKKNAIKYTKTIKSSARD
ncbi:MAG: 4Fe-4S binding protein [Eubacteriales bacterium]